MERFERLVRLANEYERKGYGMKRNALTASEITRIYKYANEHGVIAAIYLTWGAAYMTGKNYRKR